jgi:hypothetical protein
MTVTAARELHKDQRGAIMLMGLCMSCFLIGGLWFLIGIGDTIVFRDQMQEATDHAAFTSAVLHAKGMNFLSACNLILLAIIAIHILMGIIHDILLAVCIVGALFSLGTSCIPWVNFRKLYTGYFKIMTPVAKGIHFVEEVAQIGYPFIAVAKAYTLGNDYGKFGPKKRDINMLALSTSLIPGNALSGAVNSIFGNKPAEKLPDGVEGPTRPADAGYSKSKKGFLPVEAKHFDTICERIGTQGIKALVSLTGESRGGKVMDLFYKIVGSILKVRYCCDLGEGCKEGLKGVVGGKLDEGNKKIEEDNKAISDKNKGLKDGEKPQDMVEPVKDTGGDSYVLDPGFSKFWGKDGPYVPWSGTSNGSPWQQIWAINVMPSFDDAHQKKVHIGANNKGGIEDDSKAYAYLAQAEFFYDCTDKWSAEACDKSDNAGYGIKWRARLRRLQLPQIGSMLSSFGGEFLKNMTAYKDFKKQFGQPALEEKFGKSIGVTGLSKAIGGLFGMIEKAVGSKILGPAGELLNKAQNGLTGDFGVYH